MTTNQTIDDKLQTLDTLIAKLRYVKYGDIWLSSDQNDKVDCIKQIREILKQMNDKLKELQAAPPTGAPLEGDYTNWTLQWKQECPAYPNYMYYPHILRVLEPLDKLILIDTYYGTMDIRKLSDGALLEEYHILTTAFNPGIVPSILKKYIGVVRNVDGVPTLIIYKDGTVVCTIDLTATCNWTNTNDYYIVTFSDDGKYIIVANTYPYPKEFALFKGS